MNHQFLVMWCNEGLEFVVDITADEQRQIWEKLKGKLLTETAVPNVNHMILRARYNTHRHYEIYTVEAVEGITADDMESGKWDGAEVEIIEVNYKDLTMGHNWLRVGSLGEIQRSGQTYNAELRGLMHKLQNNIGRVVKPSCDAVLGDARCGVDLEALRVSGEVTVATSNRLFTTDLGGSGTYSYGVLTWTSTGSANIGLSMEVKAHTATGVLELQLAMPYDIEVGDEFTITPGCDKTKATCIATFDNVVNFRGFSFVPGQDKVLLVGGQ